MRFLRQNTATKIVVGPFIDKTDGFTLLTGMTVSGLSINVFKELDDGSAPTAVISGVAPTTSGGSNDMVRILSGLAGCYDLEITATQINFTGRAKFVIYDADVCLPYFEEWVVVEAAVYDGLVAGSAILPVDVISWAGAAPAAMNVYGYPVVDVMKIGGQTPSLDAAYNLKVHTLTIADNAITSTSITSGAVDKITSGLAAAVRVEMDSNSTDLNTLITNVGTLGSGATPVTITVKDSNNVLVQGAGVYVYSAATRLSANLVASGTTGVAGTVTFGLNASTTYYMRASYHGKLVDWAEVVA